MILIVEDLHWADAATRDLLGQLEQAIAQAPVLLITTDRTSPPGTTAAPAHRPDAAGHDRDLFVDKLSRAHSARLVAGIARSARAKSLPFSHIARIVERSDGVPLFIEELTHATLETAGTMARAGRETGDVEIPATLRDSLTARLDGLGHGAPGSLSPHWIARVGACIGREFSQDMLARVIRATAAGNGAPERCDTREDELVQALERLEEADLVRREQRPNSRSHPPLYRFKHALVHDAACAGLWREDRKSIHACILALLVERRAAGEAEIGAERLAHHACEAGKPDAAARYWLAAGEEAAIRSDLAEARICAEEALSLAPTIPADADRARIEMEARVALGALAMVSQGFAAPAAERHFGQAVRIGERFAGTRTATHPAAPAGNGTLTRGGALAGSGPRRHAGTASCAEPAPADLVLPAKFGRQTLLLGRGLHHAALRLARECLTVAGRSPGPTFEVEARRQFGISLFWCGRPREACRQLVRIPALHAHSHGVSLSVLFGADPSPGALAFLSLSQAVLGLSETALETSHHSLRIAMDLNHAHTLGYALVCRAWLFAVLRRAESEEAAQTALDYCRNRALPFWTAWAEILKGQAMIGGGEAEKGLRLAKAGLAAFRETGASIASPYFLAVLAAGEERLGAHERAAARLEDACERAGLMHEAVFESELWRQQACLEASREPETAERLFARALKRARQREMLLFEARTALDFARWLNSLDRPGEARRIVRKSLKRCRRGEDEAGIAALEALLETARAPTSSA